MIPHVTWSVDARLALQMLIYVIQTWQDSHKASRSMQCGMFLVISLFPHMSAYYQDSPSDCPIGNQGMAHLP